MRPKKPLPWWASGLIVLAAAALILSPSRGRQAQAIGSRVFEPIQLGVSGLSDQLSDFMSTVRKVNELADQNRRDEEEIDRLRSEIVRLQEVQQENEDLRGLLGLRQSNPTMQLVPVRVIGRDPSPFAQGLVIDRGTNDGVQKDMVVITWRGLVGRVVQADPGSSKVLLVTDVNSSVSARIQNPDSRATGVVRGTNGGALLMEHIQQQDPVKNDELVITSGLGGVFPEGLILGKVVQVQHKDVDVFQEAVIQPAVDVTKLERLYVLANPTVAADTP